MSPPNNVPSTSQGMTQKTSVQTAATSDALIKLRNLPRSNRTNLSYGPTVQLRSFDGQDILAEMPFRLFDFLSDKKDLIQHDKGSRQIRVPEDPDVKPNPMKTTSNLFKDLHIASAADFLGLRVYTQRLVNAHWQRLKTTVPTPADIDVICKVDTPLGNKLFKVVSHDMAELLWGDELPNPSAFAQYLDQNPRFGTAVKEYISNWEASAEAFQVREERRSLRSEQQQQAEERLRECAKVERERRANERIAYETIEKKNAEIGEVVRDKMRHAGNKYTTKEARYIYNTFGKRVPATTG